MKLKQLLPYDSITLHSPLSPEDIGNRLLQYTDDSKMAGFRLFPKKNKKEYRGSISAYHFSIQRVIAYRNSFLPFVRGQMLATSTGTDVRIKIRPHAGVLIFMSFWLGVVGIICLLMLGTAIVHFSQLFREGISLVSFMPFLMFAFGYCLLLFGYRYEASIVKEFLVTCFKADLQQF